MLETKNITRKDLIEKLLKMKTTSTQPISTPADRPMISKEEQYNNEDGVSSPSSLPALPNKNYFATWLKDTFTHFDTNGNEKLDKDELFRLCLSRPCAPEALLRRRTSKE